MNKVELTDTIEFLQDQLDDIRAIVEEGKVLGIIPRIEAVLER